MDMAFLYNKRITATDSLLTRVCERLTAKSAQSLQQSASSTIAIRDALIINISHLCRVLCESALVWIFFSLPCISNF